MFGIHDLALFVASGLLLNMMPDDAGAGLPVHHAAQRYTGMACRFGGDPWHQHWHHGACACCRPRSLSALLSASAELFTAIKLAGAIYLVYLGISLFRQPAANSAAGAAVTLPALSYGRIYRQGVLTNLLNPKVALFFLAFVPQFIAPDAPDKALAFILLGCIFNLNGMIWCHFLVFSTAYARNKVKLLARIGRWLNWGIGTLFVGLKI